MRSAFIFPPTTFTPRKRARPRHYCSIQPPPSQVPDESQTTNDISKPVNREEKSALDDVPQSLKLNAVAAEVAKRKDYSSTLKLLSEMSSQVISLDLSTQTAILNSSITNHEHMSTLLTKLNLPGYNSVSLEQAERNEEVMKIDPDKPLELSTASLFVGIVSTSLSVEVIEPIFLHHSPDEANAVLLSIAVILFTDRYTFSGNLWQVVQKGLSRFISNKDINRISKVDAAYFIIAYILGIPWLCYKIYGKQAFKWLDNVPSADKIDKCLMWLVAGVAMELEEDGTLILSNLNAAKEFMRLVRKSNKNQLSAKECDVRIKTAIVKS